MTNATDSGATNPQRKCDTCGNVYDRAFHVLMDGEEYCFDSFECAIAKLAPVCAHCQIRVIGHGVESDGTIFCCAQCARHTGVRGLRDHQEALGVGYTARREQAPETRGELA